MGNEPAGFRFSKINTELLLQMLKEQRAREDSIIAVRRIELLVQKYRYHIFKSRLLNALITGAVVSTAADKLFDASGGEERLLLAEAAKALRRRGGRRLAVEAERACGQFNEEMRDLTAMGDEVETRASRQLWKSKNEHDVKVCSFLTSFVKRWKRASWGQPRNFLPESSILAVWAVRDYRANAQWVHPLDVIFDELYGGHFYYTWRLSRPVVDYLSERAERACE